MDADCENNIPNYFSTVRIALFDSQHKRIYKIHIDCK